MSFNTKEAEKELAKIIADLAKEAQSQLEAEGVKYTIEETDKEILLKPENEQEAGLREFGSVIKGIAPKPYMQKVRQQLRKQFGLK